MQLFISVMKDEVEKARESKETRLLLFTYVHIPITYLGWHFDIDHVKSTTLEETYKADSKSVVNRV